MAKLVLTDVTVKINSVDLSANVTQAELAIESDNLETTAFGTNGWRSYVGGLKQANLTLSFQQDYAAGSVDATLWPLLNTLATVVITPAGTAVSASNPSYTMTCLINNVTPINGQVGDLSTFDVTFPVSGAVTRATA